MRKIILFGAAAAVLILIGVETWLSVGTLAPTDQFAGPTISPLYTVTSTKAVPSSPRR